MDPRREGGRVSGPGGPGLPRGVARLLARVLPDERREEILGDLEEAYRARVARRGEGAARRRLWLEAAALVLWRARTFLRGGSGRTAAGARDFLQDVRFGARTLRRRPGFAFTAVAVLGLGIGAPVTVLTLVSRIFLERPPHVAEPHRLVRVWHTFGNGQVGGSLMNPDFAYYREHATTLSGLAAWGGHVVAAYTLDGAHTDQLDLQFASDNFFDVLGVTPERGRFFLPEENAAPGAGPVVVVSDGFWRRALGADPDMVGRTLTANGVRLTVVGVTPPGFRGLSASDAPDAWTPIAMFGALTRAPDTAWWEHLPDVRSRWLYAVGRLAPGVTFEAARAELTALASSLTYTQKQEGEGVMVSREAVYSPAQASTLATLSRMLLAVVLIVLAIATANVAVLLLSRATTRSREIAVRTAIGAGRGRVFRQLLAESLVLGVAGGALGIALAYAFSDAAGSLLPYRFAGRFTPDGRVLAGAVALSLVTAVLAGLAPALHATRSGMASSLHGTRAAGSRGRGRDALVVGQVALSLVLVAGAVLFARSFWSARSQDLGFATDHRLVLGVDLRALGYTQEEGEEFLPRALERLAALPGVTGVTASAMVPFQGDWSTDMDPPPGVAPDTDEGRVTVGRNAVAPGYFDVMGMPILRGRPLGPEDAAGAPGAVVVNETLARHLWPGRDPLGQRVPASGEPHFTVVGVARDATYYELGEKPATQAWTTLAQTPQPGFSFIVRTSVPPTDVAAFAQAALRELDPNLAFGSVTTLGAVFSDVTARYRVSAVLVGLFGALALILAVAGLYGVVAFLVAQRTREIGVRMALGADRGRIARDVLRSGLTLAGAGVAVGLAGTLALRGLAAGLLYGVSPGDPWAVAAACAVLVGAAALASFGPARRATRVDPMEAIRAE